MKWNVNTDWWLNLLFKGRDTTPTTSNKVGGDFSGGGVPLIDWLLIGHILLMVLDAVANLLLLSRTVLTINSFGCTSVKVVTILPIQIVNVVVMSIVSKYNAAIVQMPCTPVNSTFYNSMLLCMLCNILLKDLPNWFLHELDWCWSKIRDAHQILNSY